MKPVLKLFVLALALWVAVPTPASAKTDDKTEEDGGKGRSKAAKAREARKQAQDNKNKPAAGLGEFTKEFEALTEALPLLDNATDEKSAAEVAKKLQHTFSYLPAPMGGSNAQLEEYARAQNRINLKMEKMKKEPWFVSSGMQKAWTLITVPSTRRAANLKR